MRTSESRMVTTRQHPTLPLEIRSYNKRAFYTKTWNEETMNSRGHVTDLQGRAVSVPFTKFLNIGETEEFSRPEVERLIDKHRDEVRFYHKLNGHFCQLFEYEGQWINTTKGTFEHDFIAPDRELIRRSGLSDEVLTSANPNWTFLFEILGDHDRHMMHTMDIESIGCPDEEVAVIIGVFDRQTGREILEEEARYHLTRICAAHDVDMPYFAPAFSYSDMTWQVGIPAAPAANILDMLYELEDTEGVVIHIPSINWRVKLKTNWFIRNRYIRQFDNERLTKLFLKQRTEEQIFAKVPEELHEPLAEIWAGVVNNLDTAKKEFMELSFELNADGLSSTDDMVAKYTAAKTPDDSDYWLSSSREIDTKLFRAFISGEDALFDAVVNFQMETLPDNALIANYLREDLL